MGAATLAVTFLGLLLGQASGEVIHTRDRSQSIPINIQDARRAEIRELVLYASADQGKTWNQAAVITPEKSGFVFVAPADGTYWLRSAIVNRNGQQQPENPAAGRPEWVLVIDTAKPTVRSLHARRQGDEVVVTWDVQEEHPDWGALRLEYQLKGASVGTPIEAKPGPSGQAKFRPAGSAPLTVRLTVRDQAGNVSIAQDEVAGTETVAANYTPNVPPASAGNVPPPVNTPSLPTQIPLPGGNTTAQGASVPPPIQTGSNQVWTQGQAPASTPPPPPVNVGSALPAGGSLPPPTRNDSALRQVASQGIALPPAGNPPQSAPPAAAKKVIADSTVKDPPAGQTPPRPGSVGGLPDTAPGSERRLPPVQYVNQPRVVLEYEVSRIGPSGLGSVEIWMTKDDGATDWVKYAVDRTPQETTKGRHQCSVPLPTTEGVYGFTLLLRNRAGFGKAPPSPGDAPAIRVELDVTPPPIAKLVEPELDRTRPNALVMQWLAEDKNLGERPITLEWAERSNGPWNAIGVDLPNTGRYSWKLPERLPARVFLRLRVRDLAGNESIAVTADPQPIDLTEPEGQLINVSAPPRR